MLKKCTICEIEKDISEFYTRDGTVDGFRNNCKICHKRNTKKNILQYHEENIKNGIKERSKFCPRCKQTKLYFEFSYNTFRKDGLHDYCKICDRKGAKIRRNKINRRYNVYMHNAGMRGLEFNLSFDVFEKMLLLHCTYCGEESTQDRPNGIDRIDNDIGYTIENSVACCSQCNFMKKVLHKNEFLLHVKKIYEYGLINENKINF